MASLFPQQRARRGVAQPGSALGLGPRGRRFESSRPDHLSNRLPLSEHVNVVEHRAVARKEESELTSPVQGKIFSEMPEKMRN